MKNTQGSAKAGGTYLIIFDFFIMMRDKTRNFKKLGSAQKLSCFSVKISEMSEILEFSQKPSLYFRKKNKE